MKPFDALTKAYPNGFYAVCGCYESSFPAVGVRMNGVDTRLDNATYGTELCNQPSGYGGFGVEIWHYNYPLKVGDIVSAANIGSSAGATILFGLSY